MIDFGALTQAMSMFVVVIVVAPVWPLPKASTQSRSEGFFNYTSMTLTKNSKKADSYLALKPSNMISRQFLIMTVDLIIKFRVDPSSQN